MGYTEDEKEILKTILENKERILNIDISNEVKRTLKIVIDIIEKQKEEIENQKNIIKEKAIVINNQELDKAKIHNNWQKELKENYVPKEAIREKIEWLENNILENDYASGCDMDIAEYQIDILKELLGE